MTWADDAAAALEALGDEPTPDEARAVTDRYPHVDILAALASRGGGGGGSGLSNATVTLNDAQIKALQTTAVQVVAAPGAGNVVVPIAGMMVLDSTAGAYTAGSEFNLFFNWGSTLQPASNAYKEQDNGAFEDASVKMLGPFLHIPSAPTSMAGWLGNVDNLPLTLFAFADPAADLDDGNVANTLKVVLQYVTMDVL